MQIVIDIPDKLYKSIKQLNRIIGVLLFEKDTLTVIKAIKNGIPLPKGHGDLIDRNEIEYLKAIHDLKWGKITANECATKIKYSAPTIIEADKERGKWE